MSKAQGKPPDISAVKDKLKTMWSTGDFGVIAKILEPEEKEFIKRLNIQPGAKVLDVACGSGTIALECARKGAVSHGIDIVEDLIRQSKQNAAAEKLKIDFIVGDAEAMPYADNEFDYVLSMFGAMFCPRPDVAASELVRAAKPGGLIVMGNWTKGGFGDAFFQVVSSYTAPPPPGAPVPVDWGSKPIAQERFKGKVSKLELTQRKFRMHIPYNAEGTTEHYVQYFGPVKMVHDSLDEGKQASFREDLNKLWTDFNTARDGTTVINTEYLEVKATK
jgi:ubiquinone/menaquinone biosynthesis C-methylase UbiE